MNDRRGYTWETFTEGNEAAVTHGAYSPRRLAPIVDRLRSDLAGAAPWTTGAAFAAAVNAWAHAEAQCVLLRDFLDEVGMLDAQGEPRAAFKVLSAAEGRAHRIRQQLGLDPSAWAQLYRTLTVTPDGSTDSLAALRATGAQMLEASTTPPVSPRAALPAANHTGGIPVPENHTGPHSGSHEEGDNDDR